MTGNGKRDIDLFTEAIELPNEERIAFLDRACAGDEELRRKIEKLLKFNDRAGDFLETPPTGSINDVRAKVSAGEKPGDLVDRYKLLQQIGEGGCGIVFLAEQEEPVHRRVALKIIKPGMDTKSVVARFEAERQALALMDHRNIAKIFDAGATDSGRPYFVMELVRGAKITEYCDQHALPTEERLKLFVQVCQAIQHAHQKGIIHRDIKPSNILVTTTLEGTTLPVVIDFGIAKATTNQRLTDKTLFTAFEMLIGTPAYMSPEQAALTNVEVDTRTDIYSLGVLLYELLTGSTPFDTQTLLKSGLDEIRRVVREQEPVSPSARLSKLTDADLTTVAQYRHSEPSTLVRTVRGDLDWIVMKALEKDRTRRYATANGLALDIQRFLANEPVSARPPSKIYKLQKAVLRNKLLFTGAGIIALLLVVSLVVVSASFAKERQSRVKSQEVTKILEEALKGAGPAAALGQDTTMLRGILDRTAERVGKEMTNQPAMKAELCDLIGKLELQIGNWSQAQAMLRTALAINRRLFGTGSKEAATSLNALGLALMPDGKLPEAEKAHREALAIRRRLFGSENAYTATSMNDLGTVYRDEGRLTEAKAMATEALGIRQRLLGSDHLDVADSLRNLSIILGDEGKWAESEKMAREVLAMRRKLLGPEHPWVASSLNDVAWAAGARGQLEEAETLERQALAIRQKVLGTDHPDVARSLYLVGDRMRQRANLKEAYSVLSAALSIQRKLLAEDNPDLLYTLKALGSALEAESRWSEAEPMYREALGISRKFAGNENPDTLYLMDKVNLSVEAQGKWPQAETGRREELAAWRKRAGDDATDTISALDKLGANLDSQGKRSDAEILRREALASWRKCSGNEEPVTLYAMGRLGSTLEGEHKWSEAEALYREELSVWRKKGANEAPHPMYVLRTLGSVLEAENKWPEAEAVRRETLAVSRKQGGREDSEALMDLDRLVHVLLTERKFGEADQLLGEVLTPAFVSQPSSVNLLSQKINLNSRQGRWQEATVDSGLLVRLQPAEPYHYHRLAALLAFSHNQAAYEQLCQKILATFTNTANPYVDERMAQDCLLLPHSGVDRQLVDKLADLAVTLGSRESSLPYFQGCKAMSNYRLGHLREAIDWAEKAANNPAAEAQAKAKAFAILAMAHWQLGQKDAAREALAKGDSLAPAIQSARDDTDLGQSWVAWLIARISLDEATELIQTASTIDKNSNQP
jgi:serine/threonine protein kinase